MEKSGNIPKAHIKKPARFPLIWLVPLVAAMVAGWLVWDQLKQMGPTILVQFRDGTGLTANQTVVKYRGVRVGNVRSVELSTNIDHVEVKLRLDRSAAALAQSGSTFWVVRPEVAAGGFHGLETIVSGSYIQVQPGNGDGKPQKSFVGLDEAPILPATDGGTEFILSASGVRSLAHGSPVYYRGLEVGRVDFLSLSEDSTTVDVHILVKAKFASLVRANSVFWNAGGIDMNLRLLGVSFSAENFKSLVIGGIAFATPNDDDQPATNNTVFALHEKIENKWLEWSPSIVLTNPTVATPANQSISPLNLNE
jgi:paraquat-inducible protein B